MRLPPEDDEGSASADYDSVDRVDAFLFGDGSDKRALVLALFKILDERIPLERVVDALDQGLRSSDPKDKIRTVEVYSKLRGIGQDVLSALGKDASADEPIPQAHVDDLKHYARFGAANTKEEDHGEEESEDELRGVKGILGEETEGGGGGGGGGEPEPG